MEKVIVYQNELLNGSLGVALLFPTPKCLQQHTIEEIAEKDVPAGRPYKIMDTSALPDNTFFEAWEVDEADLSDGTGGEHDMFITDPQHPDYVAPETAE